MRNCGRPPSTASAATSERARRPRDRGCDELGGDPVRLFAGRLQPHNPAARAQLAKALEAAGTGDAAMAALPSAIAFPARDQRVLSGIVVPLMSGRRRLSIHHRSAVAALFVREARFEVPIAIAIGTLRERFGLTPREIAILVSMAESGGVAETALVMGLSELTVRTHVRAIYRKTRASSGADLIRLVSGLASPFG